MTLAEAVVPTLAEDLRAARARVADEGMRPFESLLRIQDATRRVAVLNALKAEIEGGMQLHHYEKRVSKAQHLALVDRAISAAEAR
jgi:hypothetical protein